MADQHLLVICVVLMLCVVGGHSQYQYIRANIYGRAKNCLWSGENCPNPFLNAVTTRNLSATCVNEDGGKYSVSPSGTFVCDLPPADCIRHMYVMWDTYRPSQLKIKIGNIPRNVPAGVNAVKVFAPGFADTDPVYIELECRNESRCLKGGFKVTENVYDC